MKVLVTQSCPNLCNAVDCSPPGSSVHGIFLVRILSGVAFPPPGDLSNAGTKPRTPALQADSLSSEPIRKRNRAHFGRIQMDRWYQPKRTRAHNGVCGPALGLYSQQWLHKASLLYLQKTKGKTIRVSSWEFPQGLAVGILSFHCHDPSSLPRQGTEILKGTCCGQKKKNEFLLIPRKNHL